MNNVKSIKAMSNVVLNINKQYYIKKYGIDFYKKFKKGVNNKLNEIVPVVPDIGEHKSSYFMVIFYIAWFKVLKEANVSTNDANFIIWDATENCLKKIPGILIPFAKKMYILWVNLGTLFLECLYLTNRLAFKKGEIVNEPVSRKTEIC
ncbi:hypothetical protein [Lachnoclostridium sp.]|uniref:hypothetical protein n=1 Tax=Lachnoclostridium sp. TaxID=2028282 RepID=UPI00289F7FC3|nr:hypothetical protein [Lachnoclostridium sp.]